MTMVRHIRVRSPTSLDADNPARSTSIDADNSLDEALAALVAAGVGRLPVVSDGEDRRCYHADMRFAACASSSRCLVASLEELNYEVSPNDYMFDGRMAVYLGGGLDCP